MNVILTGIPRSGTTFVCHLLNMLPDTVALHEPMDLGAATQLAKTERINGVRRFFLEQRWSLLNTGTALSKVVDGLVPANDFALVPDDRGLRPSLSKRERIQISKELRCDFTLVIKHPAFFTAELPSLQKYFRCFAMVRNPLAILMSWGSVRHSARQGRLPVAEAVDEDLACRLDQEPDCLQRQLKILDWCFARYKGHLPREQILRYETVIDSGGRSLGGITGQAERLKLEMVNQNANPLYHRAKAKAAARALFESDGSYWQFYSEEEVEELLESLI
jgi:hypothetical protein